MLFLPQDVYDARDRLTRDLASGKISAEAASQEMLDADPHDCIALLELGVLRSAGGDFAAAEDFCWRAIQAHPCIGSPYLTLARLLRERPDSAALSEALAQLGIAKNALIDETFLEGLDFQKLGIKGKALKDFRKLPPSTQGRLIAIAMRTNTDGEPEAVTGRLRQLRLIHRLQDEGDLSSDTVDLILEEGESMVPLLVGVLRDWAQDLLGDAGDPWVENALALLGETGSAPEIPHLLEFVDLQQEDASGPACWALGRILDRHPLEAAQCIGTIVPRLGPAERLAIAEQILHHPAIDPAGKLLIRLSEDLDSMPPEDRDAFFPMLLTAIAVGRGSEVVKLGRAALLKQRGLLSSHARRGCDDLLNSFPAKGMPPLPMEPSPFSVYDICAGDAIWDAEGDDEDEDEEEDEEEEDEFAPAPEPVRRPATPGRNDPCWCNSGKKYKKCHLESDQRRGSAEPHEALAVSRPSNEFGELRSNIGKFLEQLPQRDVKLALKELFGDGSLNPEDTNLAAVDWMIHDWIAPSLGRTVLQEFLVRRGSHLTPREREMVEAWSRSFIGLYEVQELTAGVGIKLKDLIFGETFFVHDVNMSTLLTRWDGLLARVLPGERGTELGGVGLTVPRHGIEPFQAWMERDREEAGLEWRDYLKGNWPRIRRQSFEIAASWMRSLRLSNMDGEEILLSKAVYAVDDPAAAIDALRRHPEFDAEFSSSESDRDDTAGSFVWLDKKKTVLGKIRIAGSELVLDCNSRERMDRGKLLLSSLASESLRHLRDEFTTQKEIKSRAASTPGGAPPPETEIPKEVRDEAIANFLAQHYGNWPDTNLPALNGKTPRQAARTAQGRKQLIAVLKDIENGEDRKRKAGEPFYDVARLRAELGLES